VILHCSWRPGDGSGEPERGYHSHRKEGSMSVKKILMLVGDFVEDYEVLGTKIEP
jgi:hypothetical protein